MIKINDLLGKVKKLILVFRDCVYEKLKIKEGVLKIGKIEMKI